MTICVHFGVCGGCTLQNLSPEAYRARKRETITVGLARVGLSEIEVEEPVLVPEKTRRRAVFKLGKESGAVTVGFHAARSHAIVDMHECLVLAPALLALTERLRHALAPVLSEGEKAELHVTQTDTGLDLAFRSPRKLTAALTSAIAQSLGRSGIARIIFNGEMLFEQNIPTLAFADIAVPLPPHAFLQASREGEALLTQRVLSLTQGAKNITDLFAGLGTFTLPLAKRAKMHAVEQDGTALAALADAARKAKGLKPVTTEKRDLFKTPLTPLELNRFDAVVLDPPRVGAEAQVKALAGSKVKNVVYVSCDAGSFARDAAMLVKAGFHAGAVTPVDQFLYSNHIELVGSFTR
jgi:23S rRNA (uracil1939-C5)-methyltransferase